MDFIENIKNSIDFYIRQKTKFSREGYNIPNEDKSGLFEQLPSKEFEIAVQKEKEFYSRYNLKNFKENSSVRNYLENLYIIDLLEQNLDISKMQNSLKVLDIGSKDWFYAKGEHSFFKEKCKDVELKGVEIDAYRVYSNFYSRFDAAQYNIKWLENTQYKAIDFLTLNNKYDYITWFFPFITKTPLMRWGLPLKLLKPEKMLLHAYNSLNKGGKIIIVNQGEKEYEIQQNLLQKYELSYIAKEEFISCFLKYDYPRYVIIVQK